MSRLRYAVSTPARNEEENLRRLSGALAAQTHLPVAWVVVDDGSTDGTATVLAELAAEHGWLRPLTRDGAVADEPLAHGRRRARDLDGFLRGARALGEPVDVVVKVDADVSFAPDYFERLMT